MSEWAVNDWQLWAWLIGCALLGLTSGTLLGRWWYVWRRYRRPPALELTHAELAPDERVDVLYWLKELPDGRYAALLRAFDNTPPNAIATEKATGPGEVWIVRPKR